MLTYKIRLASYKLASGWPGSNFITMDTTSYRNPGWSQFHIHKQSHAMTLSTDWSDPQKEIFYPNPRNLLIIKLSDSLQQEEKPRNSKSPLLFPLYQICFWWFCPLTLQKRLNNQPWVLLLLMQKLSTLNSAMEPYV